MPGWLLVQQGCHLEAFCVNRKEKPPPSGPNDAKRGAVDGEPPFGIHGSCRWQASHSPRASEQFATAEAMRVIPKEATITNTTCKSIDVGASSRYQCTITYSP